MTRAVGYESVMRAVRHVFPSLCAPYTGTISSTPVRDRIIQYTGGDLKKQYEELFDGGGAGTKQTMRVGETK